MTDWGGAQVSVTPRLILRTFRQDDLRSYAELNADPEVYAWLGGRPLSEEDSNDTAAWAQDLYAAEGIGLLALERREDGAFLGMCGLHHQQTYPDEVEVAWRLGRRHWGRGYATEAASAWLDIGFGPLGLQRIISMTEPANHRSLAVMQRLGLTFDHRARVVDEGLEFDCVVYAASAERWRNRRVAPRG